MTTPIDLKATVEQLRTCVDSAFPVAVLSSEEALSLVALFDAAVAVTTTVPATFDPRDGLVQRHAKALNALAVLVKGDL